MRDAISSYPLVAQISEPDTDKTDADNDTYLPVHPGASVFRACPLRITDLLIHRISGGAVLILTKISQNVGAGGAF
jgi:hypothetical protein